MNVVQAHRDVLGGTPVIRGTRVPIRTFIEYIEGGESIDEFLDDFPSVTREQVIAFLDEMAERAIAEAG